MLLSLQGNIAKPCLCDRPYGLTHSDKETGFLPNLSVTTKYFPKKPGFWAPIRSPLSENLSLYP